jgi:hypothetical protein
MLQKIVYAAHIAVESRTLTAGRVAASRLSREVTGEVRLRERNHPNWGEVRLRGLGGLRDRH